MNTSNLTPTKLVVRVLLAIVVIAVFSHWLSLSEQGNSMSDEQSHATFINPAVVHTSQQ